MMFVQLALKQLHIVVCFMLFV